MDIIAQSILATLHYYDIFDYPLTSWEIYKYLIRGSTIKRRDFSQAQNDTSCDRHPERHFCHPEWLAKDLMFADILEILNNNRDLESYISSENGFYFLKNREALYEIRCKRTKLAAKRWKKARFILCLLQSAPFIRGIFLSGSFAIGNIRQDSDIDLFIVVKTGRIWMCRFFVTFLLAILGQRRHGDKIAGKFCLNHYITEDSLELNIPSLYNAQTYQSLVPIGISSVNFFHQNKWLSDFLHNVFPDKKNNLHNQQTKEFLLLKFFRICTEFVLSGAAGGWLERMMKEGQKKYIKIHSVKNKEKGRVVLLDTELEFHPASPEDKILDIFNRRMEEFGLIEFGGQKDSGLS